MDETQVRMAVDVIKSNGLVEVRIIGDKIYSGYFKSADKLVEALKPFSRDNIYFVFNDIAEGCYDRKQQECFQLSKNTTSDADIVNRRWLLIDIDPTRPTGVGATDEEKREASEAPAPNPNKRRNLKAERIARHMNNFQKKIKKS